MKELIGRQLKKDVLSNFGLILIRRHTILNETHIDKLMSHNIVLSLNDVEAPQTPGEVREKLVSEATDEIREVFKSLNLDKPVSIKEVSQDLFPTMNQFTEELDLFGLLSGIQAKDDYTYRHNIGVGVISTMIGKWVKLSHDELQLLTLAATLHDVGKVKIPEEVLNKPGKFTDKEYELMKNHTVYGYEILQKADVTDPRLALVALQHHERTNGKGYPNGIGGHKMDYFSKIVAVADVFHAMTSKRVYREAVPFYEVVKQLNSSKFGELDPEITSVFLQNIMTISIGNGVILNDGRKAKVVFVHPKDPIRPLIDVDGQFVDLSKDDRVQIMKIVG
ncbi:MAG: rpfG 6 [Paenibacillaceae bacterium]|jgi:HD-GYP domain-containing protein (c-di-GMP phosphodiesterase class II)|nr:rpfG 6 [Paenibacillaceae bacterium]